MGRKTKRNPHLLLENAKFIAGITRNQNTVYTGVPEKLSSFLIMCMHDSILHSA
jgi:hypothetical protein